MVLSHMRIDEGLPGRPRKAWRVFSHMRIGEGLPGRPRKAWRRAKYGEAVHTLASQPSSAKTKGAGLFMRFSFLEHTGCRCHKVSCCAYSAASPGAPCQQARASGADQQTVPTTAPNGPYENVYVFDTVHKTVYVFLGTARDRCRDRIRFCRDR